MAAAGIAGAAVGAGVAVAATVAMKDKKNRAKVAKVIDAVEEEAAGYLENLKSSKAMKQGKMLVKKVVKKSKIASKLAGKNNGTTSQRRRTAGHASQ